MTRAGRPAPHSHAVTFYDGDDHLVDEVVDYVAGGLAGDETVVLVSTPEHQRAIDAGLLADGVELHEHRRCGRYITLDAAGTLASFQVEGSVDASGFDRVVGSVIAAAARRGRPVRAFGEMVALLWADGQATDAVRLEELWNELATRHDFALLCAYPASSFLDGAELPLAAGVCDAHATLRAPRSYRVVAPLTSPAPDVVARSFLPAPTAIGAARQLVTQTLRAWDEEELAPDARIVVSELVTNAVCHAHSPFRVSLRCDAASIHIGVEDVSPVAPVRRELCHTTIGGRGMALVDGLASRWGTAQTGSGKVVWSELARTRRP